MEISQKKFKKLYDAIYNPIMSLRIKNIQGDINDLDKELFDLEINMYKEIKQALDLHK